MHTGQEIQKAAGVTSDGVLGQVISIHRPLMTANAISSVCMLQECWASPI